MNELYVNCADSKSEEMIFAAVFAIWAIVLNDLIGSFSLKLEMWLADKTVRLQQTVRLQLCK